MYRQRLETVPMRLAVALVALVVAVGPAAAAEPLYSAYPAEAAFAGRSATPILDTKEAKAFRTRLRDGVSQRPNFNGHYSFITWGCGSSCASGAVVDQITGHVTLVPFSMCCADSYYSMPDFDFMKYRKDSRLVVFYGKQDEDGPEGKFFYSFENGHFTQVSSVLAPSPQTDSPPQPSPTSTPVCRNLPSDAERLTCYDRQAGH